jgi:hypothetical protein
MACLLVARSTSLDARGRWFESLVATLSTRRRYCDCAAISQPVWALSQRRQAPVRRRIARKGPRLGSWGNDSIVIPIFLTRSHRTSEWSSRFF